MIQIYGGCHSVHDISFSLIRHPILYQCLFRFLVVALILQQIYVQDGYPLRPMLISMGIYISYLYIYRYAIWMFGDVLLDTP